MNSFRNAQVVFLAVLFILILAGCKDAVPTTLVTEEPIITGQSTATAETMTPTIPGPTPSLTSPTPTKTPVPSLTSSPTPQVTSTDKVRRSATIAPASTPTSTIRKTTESVAREGKDLYFFTYFVDYMGIRLEADTYKTLEQSPVETTLEKLPGPGTARYLEFSHYSNKVAYWAERTPLELWTSDITGAEPRLIISDQNDTYQIARPPFLDDQVTLSWSPDDRYLFVEVRYRTDANLVYDLKTGEIQQFNYFCDRVSISPKTNRLATWCVSLDLPERFAIVEWGEDIWYSDSDPGEILVERNSEGKITWEWSSSGDRIAYFDQNDPTGSLHISDAYSKINKEILPGSAYWLAEQLEIASSFSPEIQWSFDGDEILIYAKGNATHPCPSHLDTAQDNGRMYHIPCWMVINAESGEVVWTLSQLSADPSYSGNSIEKYFFTHAAISPNGKYLALNADYFGIYTVELVEIRSGKILFDVDARIDGIRWKNY